MPRDVYLIVYNSPLFPAHWTLWIPSEANEVIGKGIHVTGDAAKGFQHEFKRNYDPSGTNRSHTLVLLAQIDDKYVVDVLGDGEFSVDTTPTDGIETMALSIPAPGKSLRASGGSTIQKRLEVQNCQTWMRQFVEKLAHEGIFPESSVDVIEKAPKN